MSETLRFVLMASLGLIAVEFIYRVITRGEWLLPRAVALAVGAGIVYALAPGRADQMGSAAEAAAVVVCYGAMVLGMVAEHLYVTIERRRKLTFDVSLLLPILASPIVFIPLLALTADIGGGGAFTRAKIMVYLVAFQNGFFWKTFFESQRKRAKQPGASAPVPVHAG